MTAALDPHPNPPPSRGREWEGVRREGPCIFILIGALSKLITEETAKQCVAPRNLIRRVGPAPPIFLYREMVGLGPALQEYALFDGLISNYHLAQRKT